MLKESIKKLKVLNLIHKSLLFCTLAIISISLSACQKERRENENITIAANRFVSGDIKTNKEPDRILYWNVKGSNIDNPNITVKILLDGEEQYSVNDLQGQYALSEDNSKYEIIIMNNNEDELQLGLECQYKYLGMAGLWAVTVTKEIGLSERGIYYK